MNPSSIISNKREFYPTALRLESAAMPRQTLQAYLKKVMEDAGLSLRDVERRSKSARGHISNGYVNDILQGDAKNPTLDKLEALARGIGRPVDELIDVILGRVKTEDPSIQTSEIGGLIKDFNELSESDQKELRPSVEMLVKEIRSRRKK